MAAGGARPQARLLGERDGLVFVDKPIGVPTEPDAQHDDSVLAQAATLLGLRLDRLHAHSRLDVGVSGVVTLSVTTDARRRVARLREQGLWRRRYVALASGQTSEQAGCWTESIGRARGPRRSIRGARPESAETRFAVIARATFPGENWPVVLLALEPQTGRTHQLRVHAAAHGLPLLGDRTYGGPTRFPRPSGAVSSIERIALHSAWVELGEGTSALRVAAPLPRELDELWQAMNGDAAAWQLAIASDLG
ncbi:MAG TPA: pseudouridine synthase [Polyangiaceae bacterium]|jgi:23S rRNA-/tRNA-specific pseudouridylate synthase